MRTRVNLFRGAFVLLLLIIPVLLSGLLANSDRVEAQGGGQIYPEPQALQSELSEGNAVWTIDAMVYEGEFPEGMTFTISPQSNAGKIVSARVVWSHAPGNNTRRSRGAEFDEKSGNWVAHWDHTGGDVPPWVLVRYHWQLTDEYGNRYFTAEQDVVYADSDNASRWNSAESEEVVVYWIDLSDSYGQEVIRAMTEQRSFYEQAWGGLLPYRPRVILYGSSARFEYEQALGRSAVAGNGITTGTTSDDWGGTIQYAQFGDSADELAYGTVLHEIAHLYQGEFAHLPVGWFVEGNAEFFSLHRSDYRTWAQNRLESDDPLSFAAGFSIRGRTFRDGYQLGATVFDYLVETYGLDAHREVWDLVGANVTPFDAIEQVTGVPIERFEMDWRRWIGVDTPAPTLAPSPTPLIDLFSYPTPTYSSPGG